MARRLRLTWQAGAQRSGRWKKIYRGRVFYFDGGVGKSDLDAYRRALMEFERHKLLVDSELEATKPHRADYENAIHEWEHVLIAAKAASDQMAVVAATVKIGELRRRLAGKSPGPISKRVDLPIRLAGLAIGEVVPALSKSSVQVAAQAATDMALNHLDIGEDDEAYASDVVRTQVANAIWQDRLSQVRVQSEAADSSRTLSAMTSSFLRRSEARGIKVGSIENVRRRLEYMQGVWGANLDAGLITGKHIDELHQRLMQDADGGHFTRGSAFDIFSSVKSFIRWLDETDVLPVLPKNITTRSLRIPRDAPEIHTFSIEEIRELFRAASESLQLFMLLGLNCGMTQIDISDLAPSAVDWDAATLTRRRGKTAKHAAVPTVTYTLWPETLDRMHRQRVSDCKRLFLAPKGGPLKFEERRGEKAAKNDYIGSQFRRCRDTVGIAGEFKSLKKTSASLLRDHADFNGLESIFLDHAPRSVSDRHYAKVPQQLLNRGLGWLREQYALDKPRRRRAKKA